jgi:regulator of sirC expression with transglutaminase-like and TPR domain
LSLLQRLDAVADAWFNRALEALAAGAPGRALEWLSACCAARPTDAAARRAQAKVWAQLGHWEEARDALERAAAIEPDVPELEAIRQALREVTAQGTPRTYGRKSVASAPTVRAGKHRTAQNKWQK